MAIRLQPLKSHRLAHPFTHRAFDRPDAHAEATSHLDYGPSCPAQPDDAENFSAQDMSAGHTNAASAERDQRLAIALGQRQREKHDVFRNIVSAVSERCRNIAHGNFFLRSVFEIDSLQMHTRTLNQSQARRRIDHFPCYR